MIEDSEYYSVRLGDSMSWYDLSEKLKFSSEVIHNELQTLFKKYYKDRTFEDEDKIVALWYSYYLLIGYSFENLIKGLSVENNRTLQNINDIYKKWKYNSGHGISKIAQDNISDLTQVEIQALEKLETYIVWAGKYNIPRTMEKFIHERKMHFYNSNDYDLLNTLYDKIKDVLMITHEKNNKHNSY